MLNLHNCIEHCCVPNIMACQCSPFSLNEEEQTRFSSIGIMKLPVGIFLIFQPIRSEKFIRIWIKKIKMDNDYINKLQQIIDFHKQNNGDQSTIAQYRYMIERELTIVEFPEGGILFETKLDWDTVQQEYGHYFNEEIVGYPEKFPCIGFNVHTQHNQDQKDYQIWAFIYPKI